MSNFIVLSITASVFIIIIALVLYFALRPSSNSIKTKSTQTKSKPAPKKAASLDELLLIAKNETSKRRLSDAVMAFIQTEVLPVRNSTQLSEDARKKLSFITNICANKASDAKLISFLVHELEKRYPSYHQELELHQNMGLAKRRMNAQ